MTPPPPVEDNDNDGNPDGGIATFLGYILRFAADVLSAITWVIQSAINFVGYLVAVVNWVISEFQNFFAFLMNWTRGVLGLYLALMEFYEDILSILKVIEAIINHLIDIVGTWIGRIVTGFVRLILAWQIATPEPVPGLPACKTKPESSAICAAYYVIKHTFLGEPNGQYIVPLLYVIIGLLTTLLIVRFFLNLLARAEKVTE